VKKPVEIEFTIEMPDLWDLDHANLYSIRTTVSDASGRQLDASKTPSATRQWRFETGTFS